MTDAELRELQMLENEQKKYNTQMSNNPNDEEALMAELNKLDEGGNMEISMGKPKHNLAHGKVGEDDEAALMAELGMLERQGTKPIKQQKHAPGQMMDDENLLMQELGQIVRINRRIQ